MVVAESGCTPGALTWWWRNDIEVFAAIAAHAVAVDTSLSVIDNPSRAAEADCAWVN